MSVSLNDDLLDVPDSTGGSWQLDRLEKRALTVPFDRPPGENVVENDRLREVSMINGPQPSWWCESGRLEDDFLIGS